MTIVFRTEDELRDHVDGILDHVRSLDGFQGWDIRVGSGTSLTQVEVSFRQRGSTPFLMRMGPRRGLINVPSAMDVVIFISNHGSRVAGADTRFRSVEQITQAIGVLRNYRRCRDELEFPRTDEAVREYLSIHNVGESYIENAVLTWAENLTGDSIQRAMDLLWLMRRAFQEFADEDWTYYGWKHPLYWQGSSWAKHDERRGYIEDQLGIKLEDLEVQPFWVYSQSGHEGHKMMLEIPFDPRINPVLVRDHDRMRTVPHYGVLENLENEWTAERKIRDIATLYLRRFRE